MKRQYQKIYYINDKVFWEVNNRKALAYAKHYAKENGLDESAIYELSNKSELAYLKLLKQMEEQGEVKHIISGQKVKVVGQFKNYKDEDIPALSIYVSFIYSEVVGNSLKKHYVRVVDSVYELDKQFINEKILFDCLFVNDNYLQVLYLDDDKWVEWHISNKAPYIEENKARRKKKLAQMRAIREQQKFDRLLKLRNEGKATERQLQELYRLEKKFRG